MLSRLLPLSLLLCLWAPVGWLANGQSLPDGVSEIPFVCPARDRPEQPPTEAPLDEQARLEAQRRARYREVFPAYVAAVPATPDPQLLMPVAGVAVRSVSDTWGGLRDGGRVHEGQDIFAPTGTPVMAAAPGYVYRIGTNRRGGNVVVVVAAGGRRHYYAHLSGFAKIREGQAVDTDTVIGYVGNSGNAATTPPHLHFGVYDGPHGSCDWNAMNPLPMLVDRSP